MGLTFCIANTTNQLNYSEIQEIKGGFSEGDFVNVTFPSTASLQEINSFAEVNIVNITNFVGVVPYFLLLNNGKLSLFLNK